MPPYMQSFQLQCLPLATKSTVFLKINFKRYFKKRDNHYYKEPNLTLTIKKRLPEDILRKTQMG